MNKKELHGPLRAFAVNTWESKGHANPEDISKSDITARIWTRPDPLVADPDTYMEYIGRGYNTVIPREFLQFLSDIPESGDFHGIDSRAWIELLDTDITDPDIYKKLLPELIFKWCSPNIYISLDKWDQTKIGDVIMFIRKLHRDWDKREDLRIAVGPVLTYSDLLTLCEEQIDYIIIRDPAGPDIQETELTKGLSGPDDAAGIIRSAMNVKDNTGYEGRIIIDGACADIHDVVIAICLGADGVMLRDIFTSCIESPGRKLTRLINSKSAMQTLAERLPERYVLSNIHNMENFRVDESGYWTADYTDKFYKERFKDMKNPPEQKDKRLGELWKKASEYERCRHNHIRDSIRIDKTLDGWTSDLFRALYGVITRNRTRNIGWLGYATELCHGYL